jgi:glutathione S-transferase
MDLKEYFRENDGKGRAAVLKSRRQSGGWWNRLMYVEKPTIAMVNGWCFGGAPTLADCYLIPQIYSARRFNVALDAYPNLLAVDAAATSHPAFMAAHPDAQPDAG